MKKNHTLLVIPEEIDNETVNGKKHKHQKGSKAIKGFSSLRQNQNNKNQSSQK